MSRPSAVEPVRISCSFGVGDPCHCPLILAPCSSRKSSASPLSACNALKSSANRTPFALYQGPSPMRSRAFTALLESAGSCFAVNLVGQTLRGLQAAHDLSDDAGASLGVVHRDVS